MEEEATGSKGFFFQEAPKGLATRAGDILDTFSNYAKKESLAAWVRLFLIKPHPSHSSLFTVSRSATWL
jgi:hypothetical protein